MAKKWTTKGQKDYELPSDLASVESVTIRRGKVYYPIRILSEVAFRTMLSEWNRHTDGPFGCPSVCGVFYNINTDSFSIRFDPVPDGKYEIRLLYKSQVKQWE